MSAAAPPRPGAAVLPAGGPGLDLDFARVHARTADPGGRPLAPALRRRLEAAFGADLRGVRVHDDAAAGSAASAVAATAFTRGQDVYLDRRAPAADSAAGTALLAHEVAHVVQQARAGDAPRAGTVSSPGDRLEVAAERAADAVMAGRPVPLMPADTPAAVQRQAGGGGSDPLQRALEAALREGLKWDADKGVVVGGLPLREVPRGVEAMKKLSRGDVQGVIELYKPRDPREREKLRQQVIALQREFERVVPAEERQRLREEAAAEAGRLLGLPRPGAAEPGLRLPELTLDPRAVGLWFGTTTHWVLDRFRLESSTLEAQHRATLRDLARQAAAEPEAQIEIVGHADTTGPDAFNQGLAERRAGAVRDFLLAQRVPATKITSVTGRGAEAPLVVERTEDDRARNRRVEIIYRTGVRQRGFRLLREPLLEPPAWP